MYTSTHLSQHRSTSLITDEFSIFCKAKMTKSTLKRPSTPSRSERSPSLSMPSSDTSSSPRNPINFALSVNLASIKKRSAVCALSVTIIAERTPIPRARMDRRAPRYTVLSAMIKAVATPPAHSDHQRTSVSSSALSHIKAASTVNIPRNAAADESTMP